MPEPSSQSSDGPPIGSTSESATPRTLGVSRDAIWVIGGRIMGVGGTALIALLLPNVLPEAECGRFWLFQNIVELACLFAVFGLPIAMVRILGKPLAWHDRSGLARRIIVGSRVLAFSSLVSTVATVGILWVVSDRILELAPNWYWLLLLAASVLVLAWTRLLVETIRGLGELRWSSVFAGGQTSGAPGALLFCAVLAGWSFFADLSAINALAVYAVSLAVILPGIGFALWRTWRSVVARMPETPSESQPHAFTAGELVMVSAPICLSQLFAYITISSELIFAGIYCQPEDVALLGQSRRLLLLLQLPTQMAIMTLASSLAQWHARGEMEKLQRQVRRATTICAALAFAIGAVLLFAPGTVMATLFGDFYRNGAPLVVVAVLGQLVVTFFGGASFVLMMTGHERSATAINAASAAIMLLVAPFAGMYGGVLGIASATAIVWSVQSVLFWWIAHRKLGIWTHASLRTAWRPRNTV